MESHTGACTELLPSVNAGLLDLNCASGAFKFFNLFRPPSMQPNFCLPLPKTLASSEEQTIIFNKSRVNSPSVAVLYLSGQQKHLYG